MKKVLLIVLIVSMCVSIVGIDVVLAKVKFGNWNKWDEELPPAENQSWYWAIPGLNEPIGIVTGLPPDNKIGLLFSDIYFYGDKKGKTKASVFFYSTGEIDKKDCDIPNGHFALVAFPPKRGNLVIRAYIIDNKVFKFFEQWEIKYKDREEVLLKDTRFWNKLEEWIRKILAAPELSSRPILSEFESLRPKLMVISKRSFIITAMPDMFENILKNK